MLLSMKTVLRVQQSDILTCILADGYTVRLEMYSGTDNEDSNNEPKTEAAQVHVRLQQKNRVM